MISGANFTEATSVYFGSNQETLFAIDSDTSITAIVPPGNGIVNVTVFIGISGSLNGPNNRFTYTAPTPLGRYIQQLKKKSLKRGSLKTAHK